MKSELNLIFFYRYHLFSLFFTLEKQNEPNIYTTVTSANEQKVYFFFSFSLLFYFSIGK